MEELKEKGRGNGTEEKRIRNLEDTLQELKEMGSVEVERLQSLEDAIGKLTGTETQSQSERPINHNSAVLESELNELGVGFGVGAGIGAGPEIVDTVTLAQLMQWADSALNLIGIAKLKQIVELYGLTGRIPTEMKDTILKIAEVPDTVLSQEEDQVETKHSIIALCELDRILTGDHQELFGLLRELCGYHSPVKNPCVKRTQIQIQTKSRSPGRPKKIEKETKTINPKPKKNR